MRLSGLGSFDVVAQAVQTQEGYYPGSLAYTNNNPGNLMPAGQPGCTVGAGGFCRFPDYGTGYQALLNQLALDASRGYTILQFTTKYLGGDPNNPGVAPGGDPSVYARNIANAAGVSVNDLLSTAINGGGSDYTPPYPEDSVWTLAGAGGVDFGLGPGDTDWTTVAVAGGAALLALYLIT